MAHSSSLASCGYTHVRGALDASAIASFLLQLSSDLNRDTGLSLEPNRSTADITTTTWPSGRARRVIELEPAGEGPHWDALSLSPPLHVALDDCLGLDCWDLPLNLLGGVDGRRMEGGVRHWYAPVVFPEHTNVKYDPNIVSTSSCTARTCPFKPCVLAPPTPTPTPTTSAATSWAPVSRRRFLGAGWHIDSGPGFCNDEVRLPIGDTRQGVIVLLLLSDWLPGSGGTAVIPGSHRAVQAELLAREAVAPGTTSHQELNEWVVKRMRCLAEGGRLLLPSCACGNARERDFTCPHATLATAAAAAPASSSPLCLLATGDAIVDQLVGKAGDIFLLHPLLVHGGTTNEINVPRILVNGMARQLPSAFANQGGVRTLLATLSPNYHSPSSLLPLA